jgi:hypothetical protein
MRIDERAGRVRSSGLARSRPILCRCRGTPGARLRRCLVALLLFFPRTRLARGPGRRAIASWHCASVAERRRESKGPPHGAIGRTIMRIKHEMKP